MFFFSKELLVCHVTVTRVFNIGEKESPFFSKIDPWDVAVGDGWNTKVIEEEGEGSFGRSGSYLVPLCVIRVRTVGRHYLSKGCVGRRTRKPSVAEK